MSAPVRLAAFAALLVVLGVAGAGIGAAVGPVGPGGGGEAAAHSTPADEHGDVVDGDAGHGDGAGHGGAHATEQPPGVTGLAVSEDGYTLRPETTTLPVGTSDLRFAVTGPDGEPVTSFDTTHERELHLVVVRRDTTGFQHLHPEQDAAGTWSTPLTLDRPGSYRVYADFAPAGEPARTLATDVVVPGDVAPEPLPAPSSTAEVDGYTVVLDGSLADGEVAFDVTRAGQPVDLEPYLGAGGHLVVLRVGDLGYLHVHPEDQDSLAFAAEAPSSGRYRLFLQFQHDGVVRTAAFTSEVS